MNKLVFSYKRTKGKRNLIKLHSGLNREGK